MTKLSNFIIALALLLPSISIAGEVVLSHPAFCKPGLQRQANGPFAVMLFCEDALASHLGVIYEKNMSNPLAGNWQISDRFWQNPEWAADVTAYLWSISGKELIVATSPIYGSGSVFKLNLLERTHTKLFDLSAYNKSKSVEACMFEVVSISEETKSIELSFEDCSRNTLGNIQVSY